MKLTLTSSSPMPASPLGQRLRWFLLLVILLAFARLTWQLETKNLWWDESLSLQRAESDWGSLLVGRLWIEDGVKRIATTDQHPFGYFVLLGLFVRLAGESEFVLRFPSVMAATLLVPGLWALGRAFVRRGLLPPAAPAIALLLAGCSPFYLWYGQEARMYTAVALLAVISSYGLVGWAEENAPGRRRRRLLLYLATAAAFLSTHYFAALLLPVHGLVLVGGVQRRRKTALLLVGVALAAVAGAVAGAAWYILRQPHSGANFVALPFSLLLPDLLNAYSLGLSVNIERVWWLDVGFGLLAVGGGLGALLRGGWRRGWLLPGLLITPVLLLVLASQIQPAYMNARHLGLISGFFLLLVAGGAAMLWQRQRLLGGAVALLLVGGMAYSSYNYFSLPEYGKDDFRGVGAVLRQEMMPGDVLLLNPPHMLRLFRYYLPVDGVAAAQAAGADVQWWGMPIFYNWAESEGVLAALPGRYRRVWLVTSQMYPYGDPERRVEGWLAQNGLRIREQSFYSPNSILEVDLFLLGGAVAEEVAEDATPVNAVFGERIALAGYRPGRPLWPGAAIPVTYYWRAVRPLEERYKYIAGLEAAEGSGQAQPTEREFYDGFLPTLWWTPGTLIVEESAVRAGAVQPGATATLSLQLYAAETLEKLPISGAEAGAVSPDGLSLKLPFPVFSPEFGATPEN